VPGILRGVDVDTTHFRGNCPEACAIDVCDLDGLPTREELEYADWREVLPRVTLKGDSRNLFVIDAAPRAAYLRLRIFPDGGVARLRAHGEVVADWARLRARGQVDLAAAEHGGVVVACSDMFFGSRHNLIMPGDARNMGDGWETRRRRGPGHDWTVVRLGAAGTIERVEVDTRHFKGNAPAACSLEGCVLRPPDGLGVVPGQPEGQAQGGWQCDDWRELLPRTPLQPHARHDFERELRPIGLVKCVRLNIYPDGGVGRLRLFGQPL
jgi:allantoicase